MIVLAGVLFWHNAKCADDYSQWSYAAKVMLNTSSGGANVAGNQTGFPVLIRLTSANFKFTQSFSGKDIRFTKSDGITHIPYQIERWDNTKNLAEIWVKTDVTGNNNSQWIYMFWGNAAAADSSKGNAVFDTANGFVGVWHLSDASGNATDATANKFVGAPSGTIAYSQSGDVAFSNKLNGDSSYFDAGTNTKLQMNAKNKVTVSAWINRNGANKSGSVWEGIAGKYKWSGYNAREYQLYNLSNMGLGFIVSSDGTSATETQCNSNFLPANGDWNYVTGTMDAADMFIYVNGIQANSIAKTTVYGSTTAHFKVGRMEDDGAGQRQYFNGLVDEVRLENVARSADWIKLCYQSQVSSSSWLTLSTTTDTMPVITSSPSDQSISANQTVSFTVNATGGNLVYFWQRSSNGTTWNNASGTNTSPVYSFSATLSDTGTKFRCFVMNGKGKDTSATATLKFLRNEAPVITSMTPSAATTINEGDILTLSISATGNPAPQYVWKKNGTALSGNGANTNIYSKTATVSDSGTYAVTVQNSVDTVQSADVKIVIKPNVVRPANPIKLQAHAFSSNQIRLTWNTISSSNPERIIIWYRKNVAIDTVADVTAWNLDSLVPASLADTVLISDKFSEKTRYYFGAQIFKSGLWTQITTASSANDSTPDAVARIDSNTVHLAKPIFDTLSNQIKLSWRVNRVVGNNLDIGISYSKNAMPTSDTSAQQIIQVKDSVGSAVLKLWEDISFNTTYYIALWLRNSVNGKWTAPTKYSSDSVKTPPYTWQSVLYFTKAKDTVYAFNRSIRLLNEYGDVSYTTNKLIAVLAPSSITATFSVISSGVEFATKDRGAPFYIGFKADSLPAGKSIKNIRIYQDSLGFMKVMRDSIFYDMVNGYVSVRTNNLDFPLFAMIDNTKPAHTILSHGLDAPVIAGVSVVDTVIIRDNIANLSWSYFFGRGGENFDTAYSSQNKLKNNVLSDTSATLTLTIPSSYVTQDNGVRAILTTTDGVFCDTTVLSRSVYRDGSDIAFTEENKWTPLGITADLDTPDARKVLRDLPGDNVSWKYDNTKFRVFRCMSDSASSGFKWLEYGDSIRNLFDFVRGNIVWVKSDSKRTVHYGSAKSPSLKANYSLKIAPKSFADFSMPFKFDVTVGDIVAASMPQSPDLDSLAFYEWRKIDKSSQYKSTLVYLSISGDNLVKNRAYPIAVAAGGYTVYNPTQDTVTLAVPPIPVAMSLLGKLQKKASDPSGWSITVVANGEDGTEINRVYCGYTKAKTSQVTYYPLAPGFGDANVAITTQGSDRLYGNAITHTVIKGGYSYLLVFGNNGNSAKSIRYHLENSTGLDKGLNAVLYDANTGSYAPTQGLVRVGPNSKEYRWLLVGDASYLSKARILATKSELTFIGTYPNPFKSAFRILFNLPISGVNTVKFTMYDLRGRTVWTRSISANAVFGQSEITWKGENKTDTKLGAGLYFLRMTAFDMRNNQIGTFDKKLTCIP